VCSTDGRCEFTAGNEIAGPRVGQPSTFELQAGGTYVNGQYINGTRIGTAPEPLKDADRIDVGTEQLELRIEPLERAAGQSEPHREARPTLNAIKLYDSNPPTWEGSTKRSNALELVGLVADKAIAAGRPREAEEMLRVHLTRVLNEVTTKRDVPNDTREAAIKLAIKLARATGEGRWFDYVIDVLSAGQQLVSDALSAELRTTLVKVGVVDAARLERYQATIRNLPTSFERLRAGQHVDELLRAAKVRR